MMTGKPKNDRAYVEWYGGIFESDGTKETMVQKIGVHTCTEADMKKFYPPGKQSKKKIDDMTEQKGF